MYNYTIRFGRSESYFSKLLKEMQKMAEHDVELRIGDQIIGAHCCILAAGSTIFCEMLDDLKQKNQPPILIFADYNIDCMAGIIDYMYSGKVPKRLKNSAEFYGIAKQFQILGLHEHLTENKLAKMNRSIELMSINSAGDENIDDQRANKRFPRRSEAGPSQQSNTSMEMDNQFATKSDRKDRQPMKPFQCTTCKRYFYLRIGLEEHTCSSASDATEIEL